MIDDTQKYSNLQMRLFTAAILYIIAFIYTVLVVH